MILLRALGNCFDYLWKDEAGLNINSAHHAWYDISIQKGKQV
jgi:hypothetical protein